MLPDRQSLSRRKPAVNIISGGGSRRRVRGSRDANSKGMLMNQNAKRRLGIAMNLVMGFTMLGLFLVAGLFGLVLLIAYGVIA